jgi:hypothetical protein
LGNLYVSLVSNFNQELLELLFVKVVNVRANPEFGGWNWAAHALGNHDFAFTNKQKPQKMNSVFISFHQDETSKAICIHSYIEKFRVTSEDS